jgi:hypothetical protein
MADAIRRDGGLRLHPLLLAGMLLCGALHRMKHTH